MQNHPAILGVTIYPTPISIFNVEIIGIDHIPHPLEGHYDNGGNRYVIGEDGKPFMIYIKKIYNIPSSDERYLVILIIDEYVCEAIIGNDTTIRGWGITDYNEFYFISKKDRNNYHGVIKCMIFAEINSETSYNNSNYTIDECIVENEIDVKIKGNTQSEIERTYFKKGELIEKHNIYYGSEQELIERDIKWKRYKSS